MTANKNRVSTLGLIREYWLAYGGWVELFKSPYLYMAFLLVPLTYGIWSQPNWWDAVLSILPSLLGISLAAFTLFLSAGSESFRELIAGKSDTESGKGGSALPSPFVKTATVFLHFLIVQFCAIVFALIAKSAFSLSPASWFVQYNHMASLFFWGVAFLFFLYSMTVIMAASFGVYEVVQWFDEFVKTKRDGHEK